MYIVAWMRVLFYRPRSGIIVVPFLSNFAAAKRVSIGVHFVTV